MSRQEDLFDKAQIIAASPQSKESPEPGYNFALEAGIDDQRAERLLEQLVSEGVLECSEHPTYCDKCGGALCLEKRYRLTEEMTP